MKGPIKNPLESSFSKSSVTIAGLFKADFEFLQMKFVDGRRLKPVSKPFVRPVMRVFAKV